MTRMRQKEIDCKCKFFDNHIQISDKWLRKTRFEDLTALESLRHHYIQMLQPQTDLWNSIFDFLKTVPPIKANSGSSHMYGSYNGKMYLYSYHDGGISENSLYNLQPYSKDWMIIQPTEDLPLYINNYDLETRTKEILMERLTNNIEIPRRDDLVTLYRKISNRTSRIYELIALINKILILYITNKHSDLCYHNKRWEKEYFFNLILNNRLYIIHFENRGFKLIQTPESSIIVENDPKEVSHHFFDKNPRHIYLNPYTTLDPSTDGGNT